MKRFVQRIIGAALLLLLLLTISTGSGAEKHEHQFMCNADGLSTSTTGFGCQQLGELSLRPKSGEPMYWYLAIATDAHGSRTTGNSIVATAEGRTWISTFGNHRPQLAGATPVAAIGPLPMERAESYKALLYLAVMPEQSHTRTHTHPGPEAWYVLSGTQCLETPLGVQKASAGSGMFVEPDVPMRLSNNGTQTRRALFVVIHDASKPWTILSNWQPKGLCK